MTRYAMGYCSYFHVPAPGMGNVNRLLEPLSPPYYAAYAVPVRYKTNGGLRIDENCRLINAQDRPVANVFAAGSCSGTVSPNVAPVVASGLGAGECIVADLKGKAS